MSTQSQPTRADDCERMLRILADAPVDGLSMDAIQIITEQSGEKWSLRTINSVLCDLGGQVAHQKVRDRGVKVTKYHLKRS